MLAIAIAAICVSVFWCFRFEEGALNLFVCNACTSLGFRGRKRGVLVLFSANLGQSFFYWERRRSLLRSTVIRDTLFLFDGSGFKDDNTLWFAVEHFSFICLFISGIRRVS